MKLKKALFFMLVIVVIGSVVGARQALLAQESDNPQSIVPFASDPSNNVFDISEGNIALVVGTAANTIKVEYGAGLVKDNIAYGTMITLTGTSTTNHIIIDATGIGTTHAFSVTLDNVMVGNFTDPEANGTQYGAFTMQDSAHVNMTLVGNNRLQSSENFAGLRLSGTENCALTITGDSTGSLYAASNGKGAGIGGNEGPIGGGSGKVTILGGTIEAYSSVQTGINGYGAGIGGGYGQSSTGGKSGNITIRGGSVLAASSKDGIGYGAGIGGGSGVITGGEVDTVLLQGGVVKAACSTTSTSHATGIGAGYGPTAAPSVNAMIEISGGSIFAQGVNSNVGSDIQPQPVGADGSTNVYLNTLSIQDTAAPNAAVQGGSLQGVALVNGVSTNIASYGIFEVFSDADSKVYVWLPSSSIAQTLDLDIEVMGTPVTYTATFVRASDHTTSAILRSGVQVLFDSQGGNPIQSALVFFQDAITQPSNPTKEGYTFVGWYPSVASNTPWDFSTIMTPSADNPMTLYARWQAIPLQVHFDTQGGTTIEDQTVAYGTRLVQPSNPTKAGYTFVGWYTTPVGTVAWDFAAAVSEEMTLYAKWETKTIPVTPVDKTKPKQDIPNTGDSQTTTWWLLFGSAAIVLGVRFRKKSIV